MKGCFNVLLWLIFILVIFGIVFKGCELKLEITPVPNKQEPGVTAPTY